MYNGGLPVQCHLQKKTCAPQSHPPATPATSDCNPNSVHAHTHTARAVQTTLRCTCTPHMLLLDVAVVKIISEVLVVVLVHNLLSLKHLLIAAHLRTHLIGVPHHHITLLSLESELCVTLLRGGLGRRLGGSSAVHCVTV
eukprot:GDKI01010969.1.p1 GENE.GDKI01010969.1~~GDKI01010969.1.p1  ORF type:complete len:140 (+),score=24.82 GDKI01010969.1:90-509(+)